MKECKGRASRKNEIRRAEDETRGKNDDKSLGKVRNFIVKRGLDVYKFKISFSQMNTIGSMNKKIKLSPCNFMCL